MGNAACPYYESSELSLVAQDICPFPNYNPNPLFHDFLSSQASRHLTNRYRNVQNTLTPEQLNNFGKDLRRTFGKDGQVTLGGVGVVALSLSVLFDTLASKAKGQWVPDSGPIPGLFHKQHGESYHPMVPMISEYLRLVPHIANNPTRMKDESEMYYRKLHDFMLDRDSPEKFTDLKAINAIVAGWFKDKLRVHLIRVSNNTEVESIERSVFKAKFGRVEGEAPQRDRRQAQLRYRYSLNCDTEAASRQFVAEVEGNPQFKAMYEHCKPSPEEIEGGSLLHYIASKTFDHVISHPRMNGDENEDSPTQRDNFDLKTDFRGDWNTGHQ